MRRKSGIPFDTGLIRNHYVGRTFIEPQQAIRHFGVKIKLNAIRSFLRDKRVVVVDDSIVRGTTSQKLVHMIRQAGAKEVHMRISSPPTTHPCLYGIDTPTCEELIASQHTVEEIRNFIQADSLAYLSHEGMMQVAHAEARSYCSACFTGPVSGPGALAGRLATSYPSSTNSASEAAARGMANAIPGTSTCGARYHRRSRS